MIASDFACSCAVPSGPSQLGNIAESTDVFYIFFDGSNGIFHGGIGVINGYLTNRIGAYSVFGSIRFNNSEISAGYSDLFEFHGFSENSLTGLTVAFYIIGFIVILAVLLIRDVLNVHSSFSSLSCFTDLRQCCCHKRKCQRSVRHQRWTLNRWTLNQLLGIMLCMLMLQPVTCGNPVVASSVAENSVTVSSPELAMATDQQPHRVWAHHL